MELYPLQASESMELRAFPKGEGKIIQQFLPSWGALNEAALDLDADGGYDIYFGVAPRTRGSDGQVHGRLGNIARVPVVWLDLDAKGHFTKQDRLKQLEPVPPSVLIDSGGGYHAYWLLTQDLEPKRAQRLMKGMAAHFECDDTSDPTRILRYPYTRNYKTDPPMHVDLVWETETTWDALQLPTAEVLEPGAQPSNREKRAHIISTVGISQSGDTIDGEVFIGRDKAIFELAGYLRDEHYPELDILARCREANLLMKPPLTDAEVATKVRSALNREPPPIITEIIEPSPFIATSTPKSQVMSLKEIMSFEEPPIEFLAQGMFGRSSIEFIAHPPKSGKSTVAINWGLRLAAGINGAGLCEVLRPYRVMLWQPNADMSPRRTREWIRKIRHGLGLAEDICFDFWFDDGNSRIDENLRALEERADDYDLIIIDSLNRFLPGVDAADTDVVAGSFNAVRRLRTSHPEVCWSYIVQVGKNSAQHLGTMNPSFALRGNSAVAEAYDTMIQLSTPKNTEKDPVRGLALNRHIVFHGRDSDMYRSPFRTRYNLESHVLEWETDLTPSEVENQTADTDRDSRSAQRNEAIDLLKVIFNDAEEEYGERRVLASEVYEIAREHGISDKVMRSAFSSMGGTKEKAGKKTEWIDFVVEVEEA